MIRDTEYIEFIELAKILRKYVYDASNPQVESNIFNDNIDYSHKHANANTSDDTNTNINANINDDIEDKVPGVIAAVKQSNKLTIASAGHRKIISNNTHDIGNTDGNNDVSVDDCIHLGSNTKSMTALLMCFVIRQLQLQNEKDIDIDVSSISSVSLSLSSSSSSSPSMSLLSSSIIGFETRVQLVFPELIFQDKYHDITIRDLIEHKAGLPANIDWNSTSDNIINIGNDDGSSDDVITAQRYGVVVQALSMHSTFGSDIIVGQFHYSNVGYVILGAIIERVTHLTWETCMKRYIFDPLNMNSAGFGAIKGANQCWGHVEESPSYIDCIVNCLLGSCWLPRRSRLNLTPVQIDNPSVMRPAGGVHCSIADYCRYLEAIKRMVVLAKTTITEPVDNVGCQQLPPNFRGVLQIFNECLDLSRLGEILSSLPTSNISLYAGGWIICARPWANGIALTHAGSNTTWYCSVWIAPESNVNEIICVAFNSGASNVAQVTDRVITDIICSKKAENTS